MLFPFSNAPWECQKDFADGTFFPKEIYMKHNDKKNLTINTWLGSQR